MKRIILSAMIVLACVSALPAQDLFNKKTWTKYTSYDLEFSIYLPKKFKPASSSISYAKMYQRSTSPQVVMAVSNLGYTGQLSKSEFYDLCYYLYWEFYMDEELDLYSDYEPSPIVNMYGHHGYEFQLHEWDDDYYKYYTLFQCFLDAEGNFFCIMSMSSADHSPNTGQAVTFMMLNGCASSLRKPLAPAAVDPAAAVGRMREVKAEVFKVLKEGR
jgi:hypothetical protein